MLFRSVRGPHVEVRPLLLPLSVCISSLDRVTWMLLELFPGYKPGQALFSLFPLSSITTPRMPVSRPSRRRGWCPIYTSWAESKVHEATVAMYTTSATSLLSRPSRTGVPCGHAESVLLASSYLLLRTAAGVRSPLAQTGRGTPIPLTTVAPYSGGQRHGRDTSHHTFPHAL